MPNSCKCALLTSQSQICKTKLCNRLHLITKINIGCLMYCMLRGRGPLSFCDKDMDALLFIRIHFNYFSGIIYSRDKSPNRLSYSPRLINRSCARAYICMYKCVCLLCARGRAFCVHILVVTEN